MNDGIRHEDGFMTVVGLAPGGSPGQSYGTAGAAPILDMALDDRPPRANWVRLEAVARYADAYDAASVAQHGPRRRWLRTLDANSPTKATAFATNALRRDQWEEPVATVTVPWDAGVQLYDLVQVSSPLLGVATAQTFRVIGIALAFDRDAAIYQATLTLGGS